MKRSLLSLWIVLLFTLVACGSDGEPEAGSSGLPRKTIPPPTDRPYVSVAVDNHFHDVHVEDDITITEGQGFIIKNQGSNLHNVTIPELDFNEDIATGEQVDFLGDTMPAGTYSIVCKYHASEGMIGRINVAPAP